MKADKRMGRQEAVYGLCLVGRMIQKLDIAVWNTQAT